MTYEDIFSLCGTLAFVGWAGLVFLPSQTWMVERVARLVIPGLIGLVYVVLMASNYSQAPADGGFGTLAQVKALFTVDALLLGGWIHYLAFDLFVGSWEVSDARQHQVPHLLVVPALALTLMAGPAGLLVYLLIRTGVAVWRKRGDAGGAVEAGV